MMNLMRRASNYIYIMTDEEFREALGLALEIVGKKRIFVYTGSCDFVIEVVATKYEMRRLMKKFYSSDDIQSVSFSLGSF